MFPVTVTASGPAYFRGFILIALKEGAVGDRDEDYIGNFQVFIHGYLSNKYINLYALHVVCEFWYLNHLLYEDSCLNSKTKDSSPTLLNIHVMREEKK